MRRLFLPAPVIASALSWATTCLGAVVGPEPAVVRLNGQDFILHAFHEMEHVRTFEYRLAIERTEDWTQQVTHQVFQLDRATAPTAFVAYLERNLAAAEPGVTVERLQVGESSATFRARFPATDGSEDQAIAGLVFTDAEDARRLHVLQFALKPSRLAPGEGQVRLESWVDVLQRTGRGRSADQGISPTAAQGRPATRP